MRRYERARSLACWHISTRVDTPTNNNCESNDVSMQHCSPGRFAASFEPNAEVPNAEMLPLFRAPRTLQIIARRLQRLGHHELSPHTDFPALSFEFVHAWGCHGMSAHARASAAARVLVAARALTFQQPQVIEQTSI